MTAVINILPQN